MSSRSTRGRAGATLAVATAAVVAFGVVGGTGLAGGLAKPVRAQYGPGQYQYTAKVLICHKGKGTINVSVAAMPAHLRHGDVVGACAVVASAGTAKAATSAKAAKAAKTTQSAKGAKGAKSSAPAPTTAPVASVSPSAGSVAPSAGKGNGNGRGNGKKG